MCKTYTVSNLAEKPAIKITGKWLADNGFDIGDKLELFNDNGILVLIKMDNEEALKNEKQKKILALEKQLKQLKFN